MPATIHDVARQAAVSIKTVSRVLNRAESVAPATREKVLAVMAELDYHPNANARSLVLNSTQTISLCAIYNSNFVFSNPYFFEVFRGINEVCNRSGYSLLFQARPDCDYLEMAQNGRSDGLLLMCVRLEEQRLEKLLKSGFPFVLIGKDPADRRIPWVEVDDETGSYMATKHLLQLGHKTLGYLGGPIQYVSSQKRRQGFERALAEYGLAADPDLIVSVPQPDETYGYQAMQQLLTNLRLPTAVAAFNDLMATGALRALAEKKVRVPEEIAVVGFDDIITAPHTNPPLTTIHQPAFDKGAIATQLLLKLIAGETVEDRHILLKPRLVVRKSCGSGGI